MEQPAHTPPDLTHLGEGGFSENITRDIVAWFREFNRQSDALHALELQFKERRFRYGESWKPEMLKSDPEMARLHARIMQQRQLVVDLEARGGAFAECAQHRQRFRAMHADSSCAEVEVEEEDECKVMENKSTSVEKSSQPLPKLAKVVVKEEEMEVTLESLESEGETEVKCAGVETMCKEKVAKGMSNTELSVLVRSNDAKKDVSNPVAVMHVNVDVLPEREDTSEKENGVLLETVVASDSSEVTPVIQVPNTCLQAPLEKDSLSSNLVLTLPPPGVENLKEDSSRSVATLQDGSQDHSGVPHGENEVTSGFRNPLPGFTKSWQILQNKC